MEGKMVMMMSMWAIGLVILGVNNASKVNAISCEEALGTLNPCLSYLTGLDPTPSPACCLGAEKVKEEATTTQIRRDLCTCFKQAALALGVNTDRAKQLPNLCHVQVPVPIDPNIDCSKISA